MSRIGFTETTVKLTFKSRLKRKRKVTIQLILPWPTRLGLMHLHEIRFFALKKQC
ncbi:MAG: hypothetical protein KZQ62_02615 [Candidatus Thiodiazotropha sp. (ex Lucinoma aequizonata)]|nr:hypothetical protein [Candidatus Thiodiazotropha sp. (ex Lucinoma aequizonata)]MCU7898023.1 hypothetical protein [Candidatus Thiodiazotropha sp. (ex Lucinoma aequizonata)]